MDAKGPVEDISYIRSLVETCLTTDDLNPLLRLILDSESNVKGDKAGGSGTGWETDLQLAPGARIPQDRWALVETVQTCLDAVASDQDMIIQEVCSGNAMDITNCVAELAGMQSLAARLQNQMVQGNQGLQAKGSALLSSATALSELTAVQCNVLSGIATVDAAKAVLKGCLEVGSLVESGKLYHALLLLERVQKRLHASMFPLLLPNHSQQTPLNTRDGDSGKHYQTLPSNVKASPSGWPVSRPDDLRQATTAGHAVQSASSTSSALTLQSFFLGLLSELKAAIEQVAVSEFNSWLVQARAQAQSVGMRAIRRAAIHRKLDEDLVRERRLVMGMMSAGRDVREMASAIAGSNFRTEMKGDSAAGVAPGVQMALAVESGNSGTSAGSSTGSSLTGGLPDVSTLHVGQPTAALQEILDWQRKRRKERNGQLLAAPVSASSVHGSATAIAASASGATKQMNILTPPGVPSTALSSDSIMGLLHDFDLSGLLRCVHVHKVIGRLLQFRDYYLEQRRLQVTNDLAPPHNFLETYQSYLAQVTGFFVVESIVGRLIPELTTQEQVKLLWDGASASFKASLVTALEALQSAPIMVLLKDFVLLMCGALGSCKYSTKALEDVVSGSRTRYHDLLLSAATLKLTATVVKDDLQDAVQLKADAQIREVTVLGLPLVLEGVQGANAAPPLTAPFSSCVPSLMHQIRSYVEDSVSYLRGLYSPWELPSAVFYYRNRMISKAVVEALQAKISSEANGQRPSGCMRMVANVWCLLQALDTLDSWTLQQARANLEGDHQEASNATSNTGSKADAAGLMGGAVRSRKAAAAQDTTASNVQATLRTVQDVAERAVVRLVTTRVNNALMEGFKACSWLPTGPPTTTKSPYVIELLQVVQETFSQAQARLPRPSFLFLCRTVTHSMGGAFVKLFSPEGIVRAYNTFAIQRLAADIADLQSAVSGYGVQDIESEFSEASQLCLLLLSEKVEDILVPEFRKQKYPNLGLATIVLALDRYKELAKVGKDKTNFPAKKALDAVAKQLRAQMVQGPATRALQDF